MVSIELLSSEHFHVILHSDQKHGLIINRLDGCLSTINYDDAKELSNLKRIGTFYGIVGLFLNKYLVLIKSRTLVGRLFEPANKTEHEVFVINSIQVFEVACPPSPNDASKIVSSVRYNVPASGSVTNEESSKADDNSAVEYLNKATDYDEFTSLPIKISTGSFASLQAKTNNWNPFKIANSFKPMMPAQFLKSSGLESVIGDGGGSSSTANQQSGQSTEDASRRLVEEMVKLFNETESFYFSWTLDLSHRFSRQPAARAASRDQPMWEAADERFFWNKYMLKDLIELSETEQDANFFISVILQGFIAIEEHAVAMNNESGIESGRLATNIDVMAMSRSNISCDNSNPVDCRHSINSQPETKTYQLILISRRSVFQAGTRYRRRGCDEKGNCANFVETEQIFRYNQHVTSFLLLRGSIPLYWYQTGFNYRPPPVLHRTEQENFDAISKHFNNLIETYETDRIIAVDCTEHTGREQEIHSAYKMYIEKLSITQPNVRLIEFDFHKHCHGRQSTQTVVEKHLRSSGVTDKLLKSVKYYWNDGDLVWKQDGVFRVNCLDCTDRTNVVQCAIALQILDIQLARLGIIAPDTCPGDNECRGIMRELWSRNGNVLSTQYCGTRALFTGDRKLSGYIKDTYSSASRYYISKFRDASRQAAIDAMLGVDGSPRNPSGTEACGQRPGVDQYELINLDPMLTGRGGALLKDMGNRMSNRLARLRGKLHPRRPFEFHSTNISEGYACDIDESNPEIEARLAQTLDGLNIDWPSTESMEVHDNNMKSSGASNLFAQISNSDDSFQDEDFGSLMLSVDLADLQRVREGDEDQANNKDKAAQGGSVADSENATTCEEIHMTETRGFRADSISGHHDITTSTTST